MAKRRRRARPDGARRRSARPERPADHVAKERSGSQKIVPRVGGLELLDLGVGEHVAERVLAEPPLVLLRSPRLEESAGPAPADRLDRFARKLAPRHSGR